MIKIRALVLAPMYLQHNLQLMEIFLQEDGAKIGMLPPERPRIEIYNVYSEAASLFLSLLRAKY
jgi:hypothetical protein